jgi:UDP-glucose 4-epimerase
MIHAYCHLFDIKARVFRFANVVGPRQTHGVAFDFCRRLAKNRDKLTILGDGTQSKSYIDVADIVRGIQSLVESESERYSYYHLATEDYLSVRQIADLVCELMGLSNTKYEFTGGSRGWNGDVPVIRFDLEKVRSRGFSAQYSSWEALRRSVVAMLGEIGYQVGQ